MIEVRVYKKPAHGYIGLVADQSWIAFDLSDKNEKNTERKWIILDVKSFLKDDHISVTFKNDPSVNCGTKGSLVKLAYIEDKYRDTLYNIVKSYKHNKEYNSLYGPNSNTLTQYVLNKIPEIGLKDLPLTCIGKNYNY